MRVPARTRSITPMGFDALLALLAAGLLTAALLAIHVRRRRRRAAAGEHGGTILLVEDEQTIREAVGDLLRQHGYTVIPAADGQEALRICEAEDAAIDLIVCDVIMPRLGGPGLLRALRARGSRVPFLFVSGFSPADDEAYQLVPAGTPMLQKPWKADALLRSIGAILCPREAGLS